jgi:hypothetical protein
MTLSATTRPHFGLVHVNNDGQVQFTVEPSLKSVTIDQGLSATLSPGQKQTFTATAVNNNGDDDTSPPTMPVADPMSHMWASSNSRVARIDPSPARSSRSIPVRRRSQ